MSSIPILSQYPFSCPLPVGISPLLPTSSQNTTAPTLILSEPCSFCPCPVACSYTTYPAQVQSCPRHKICQLKMPPLLSMSHQNTTSSSHNCLASISPHTKIQSVYHLSWLYHSISCPCPIRIIPPFLPMSSQNTASLCHVSECLIS